MESSIWNGTLASFCDELAAAQPAPAGVAAAAVAASLGLSLLIKALDITGKRKDFASDPQRLAAIIATARRESAKLKGAADEDIAAVRQYMESRDPSAARKAIEVPMTAARAGVAGLDLCGEAAGIVAGSLAADLGAAAALLSGAVRAILLCVDSNLQQLRADDPYYREATSARSALEDRLKNTSR
jgi:formiminotetrahydrofolate cyclodeaminase